MTYELDRYNPGSTDLTDTIDELARFQDWTAERDRNADIRRLQSIDRQIQARDTENMVKALSPAARRARAEEMREVFDMSGITRQLEEMAPDQSTARTTTIVKSLTPSFFASAWRTMAAAEAAGQAAPDQLRKATDQLHTLEYGALMENVGNGDINTAREHLRTLTATGAFASPEQAARAEFLVNNPASATIAKASAYTGPPALCQVVLSGNWSAIPPAAHQR